jgi:hypothetical protein
MPEIPLSLACPASGDFKNLNVLDPERHPLADAWGADLAPFQPPTCAMVKFW